MNTSLSIGGTTGNRGPVHLPRACDALETHEHNYDHNLQVLRGSVRVTWSFVDAAGLPVSGTKDVGVEEEFETFTIKAGVKHTVTALEDDTVFQCVFSHRDFGGVVIQRYAGNPAAYALAPGA